MAGRRRPLRPLAGIRRRRAGKTRSGVVARAGQPHAGEVLSRYDVKYLPGTKKRARVSRPRLFETSGVLPQLRLFGLEALGEAGWLKALKLEEYATRQPRQQEALQPLFANLDAS
jgi:hypothetical protein